MSESNIGDPSSSSNPGEVVVKHWDWDVLVDFPGKTLRCSVTLQIITLTDGVSNLVGVQRVSTEVMSLVVDVHVELPYTIIRIVCISSCTKLISCCDT